MIWFIIAIIAFVLIKFLLDNKEQATAVAKQGGMRKKYAVLVNHFLKGHRNCKIHQEEKTFIRVGSVSAGGSTFFDITQTFQTVTIQWKTESVLMGKHKLEWEFDQFEDQEQMIGKIDSDISAYMVNVLSNYL